MGQAVEKGVDSQRVGRRTRDSKVESNDTQEIPDRGETSDISSLPLGNNQVYMPNLTP